MPQSVQPQFNVPFTISSDTEFSHLGYPDRQEHLHLSAEPKTASGPQTISVRFWGVRGSIASQGPDTIRYGGNTACVEVRLADDTVIIFDAGTGLRTLGTDLIAQSDPVKAHLFLSHVHWDHIQGLPFFAPAYVPSSELNIFGPAAGEQSLKQILSGQMQSPYFPITMDAMAARLSFRSLYDGSCVGLPGATVEARRLNHPGPTLGYRLTANGKVLVYATDNEPFGEDPRAQHLPSYSGLRRLAQDADVLIMDAQYTPEEYPMKVGWGHSTYMDALHLAQAANVKQLVLFHHDPSRSDHELDTIVTLCNAWSAKQHCHFTCAGAVEGAEFYF